MQLDSLSFAWASSKCVQLPQGSAEIDTDASLHTPITVYNVDRTMEESDTQSEQLF